MGVLCTGRAHHPPFRQTDWLPKYINHHSLHLSVLAIWACALGSPQRPPLWQPDWVQKYVVVCLYLQGRALRGSIAGLRGRVQELWSAVGQHCGSMGESTGAMRCCRTLLWIYGAGCRTYGVLWGSALELWGRAEELWGAVGQHCGTMGQSASLNSTGLAKECCFAIP